MSKEKPAAIRIEVPQEYGDAYDGEDGRQWVERRQRISGEALRSIDRVNQKLMGEDEKMFKEACKVLAEMFTDWNLEGDEGPLPKPWGNPKAFSALFASDWVVCLWVATLPFQSVGDLHNLKN
jgi:hypothetical protein